jgi:6-phospho-beta-glucosidase
MRELKIAIIGAGSTYSPELIHGFVTREGRMKVKEFALMDINKDRLDIVGGLIKRMCGEFKEKPLVTMTGNLEEALTGADYVVTQFRVGLLPARAKDENIPKRHGIIGQETTGPGGFAKALRTIPEILKIAHCMEKVAPNATLINFTNPSGIITEALSKYSNIRVVGLCNTPITTYKRINKVMGLNEEEVFYDYFGLNHFGFIKGIYVKGKDMTDELFPKIMDHPKLDEMLGYKFNKSQVLAMRILPVGYLQYYYHQKEVRENFLKQEKTRGELLIDVDKELLVQYSDPNLKTKPAGLDQRGGAWYSEAACALMDSFENNDRAIHVINIQNNGTFTDLADDAVIEIPARVEGECIKTLNFGKLPLAVKGLIEHVKAYESLTVEAAVKGSKDLALIALINHPFMTSADEAEVILNEIIEAHPDYIHLK